MCVFFSLGGDANHDGGAALGGAIAAFMDHADAQFANTSLLVL